ncbi:MAG: hypothetical protein FJW39_35335 [Acidobacteria bacterium]|nr:hypothetical protein [Acidobacteriota bacterium]
MGENREERMHRIVSFLALAATPLAAQFTVAHRGGMARQPQNTMAAFRHAVKTGIDVLEFDLVPTRDGKLAVHHDLALHSPLCQLPGGNAFPFGAIRGLDFAEIRRLDCGSWRDPKFPHQALAPGEKILTLDEVLAAFPAKTKFLVETKMAKDGAPDFADPEAFVKLIVETVRLRKVQDRLILQSGDYRTLDAMKRMEPRAATCLVNARRFKPDYLPLGRKHKADYFMLGVADTTKEQVEQLKSAGFKIVSNVINDAAGWRAALGLGMEGLMTDDPDELMRFLAKR